MNDDAKFWCALTAFFVFLIAAAVYLGGWLAETKCTRRWKDSGMASEWAFLQGCRVQRIDGTWIPADAYREVPMTAAPPPKTAP